MSNYRITGTPIVYNRVAVLIDNENFRWTEIIEPGAARDALRRAEQVLLWNHDTGKPMASRKNNTLSVREDSSGVHITADASGTAWGRDGVEAIRAGLVNKMSFGFFLKPDGYIDERGVENGKRTLKRTVKKFDRIVDFSPVTYPAYQDTDVSARSTLENDFNKNVSDGLQRRYGEAPRVNEAPVEPHGDIEEVINKTQQSLRFLNPIIRSTGYGSLDGHKAQREFERQFIMSEFYRIQGADPDAVSDPYWRGIFSRRKLMAKQPSIPTEKECEKIRKDLEERKNNLVKQKNRRKTWLL